MCVARSSAEGDVERLALRVGEVLAELEDGRTELLHGRIVELLLALDARGSDDTKVPARFGRVLEQGGLPDSRISVDDQHAAVAIPSAVEHTLRHLRPVPSRITLQHGAFSAGTF